MPAPFDTRPYTPDDFDYVNGMVETNMDPYFALYERTWDAAEFKKTLNKGVIRVVLHDGINCGFYHYIIDNGLAKLNMIHLDPAYQGSGIGSAIIRTVEAELTKLHIHEIRLSVYPANPALRLYTRLGYEVVKEEYPKIRMRKKL